MHKKEPFTNYIILSYYIMLCTLNSGWIIQWKSTNFIIYLYLMFPLIIFLSSYNKRRPIWSYIWNEISIHETRIILKHSHFLFLSVTLQWLTMNNTICFSFLFYFSYIVFVTWVTFRFVYIYWKIAWCLQKFQLFAFLYVTTFE